MNLFTFVLLLFSIIVVILANSTTEKYDPKFPILYKVSGGRMVSAKSGEPLMLYCYSKGRPTPITTWYHSKKDPYQTDCPFHIPEKDKERIVYKNHSQELFFHQTVVEDNGFYTCNASNIVGSVAFIYNLTVLHN